MFVISLSFFRGTRSPLPFVFSGVRWYGGTGVRGHLCPLFFRGCGGTVVRGYEVTFALCFFRGTPRAQYYPRTSHLVPRTSNSPRSVLSSYLRTPVPPYPRTILSPRIHRASHSPPSEGRGRPKNLFTIPPYSSILLSLRNGHQRLTSSVRSISTLMIILSSSSVEAS